LNFSDFIDKSKLEKAKNETAFKKGIVVVYGVAACLLAEPDIHVYADMARWEIQKRYRSGEIANWKHDNYKDDALVKYKRGFFVEWRLADRHKKGLYESMEYVLDTNKKVDGRNLNPHIPKPQIEAVFLGDPVKAPGIVLLTLIQIANLFHPLAAPHSRVKVRYDPEGLPCSLL
jgi:hypothetical protein